MALEDELFPEDTELAHLARISKAIEEVEARLEVMHIQSPNDEIIHISRNLNETNRLLLNLVSGNPLTDKSPFDQVISAIWWSATMVSCAIFLAIVMLS